MTATLPQWRFSQLFGEKDPIGEVSDVDIISAIEFDETGEYLAVGDRGGRVVIFEQGDNDFKFFGEFQSHESEFDYLRSMEIEEKINKIKWCKRLNQAHYLFTTNDKTIKLWKYAKKDIKTITSSFIGAKSDKLKFPGLSSSEALVPSCRKVFGNAHGYHINSISLNSDGETFISADDLRINLWNTEISDQSFNIIDIKPDDMEELSEVITAAAFHPIHCNLFMYSSSKGLIKLNDLRQHSRGEPARLFAHKEDPSKKSFFSEIISSISDCHFSNDGRFIISRDYLSLSIWDINMDSAPIRVINSNEHLFPKLCDLYESDFIFDKFECTTNFDGSKVATGSYHNLCYIYDWVDDVVTTIEANKNYPTAKIKSVPESQKPKENVEMIDFSKKCLHLAYNPKKDVIALGASNNLFIYEATSSQPPASV